MPHPKPGVIVDNTKDYDIDMQDDPQNNNYCKGQNGSCLGLIPQDETVCMFCQGFYKDPLGPIGKQYSKYRWAK